MSGFITGDDRAQNTLFPPALDDYIHEDNPVRVIDVFVDELDLSALGFQRTEPELTGRPGYSPATMLKLYLYGYLNRIQSSRRLEREAQRNVELMWLIQRLSPDFKTIADFRKDNAAGIKNTCRTFVELCRKLNMFTESVIAVDGSKFKGVNNSDKNYTQTNVKRRIEHVEQHIENYLSQLDANDSNEKTVSTEALSKKIAVLKLHLDKLKSIESRLNAGTERQISLTDPDCRAMKTKAIGRVIGYNVQTAVDTQHHLIVSHYVTNSVSDRNELPTIAQQAQEATGRRDITVLADKGYYSGWDIKATQDLGIKPIVPKTKTSANKKKGMFTKEDFRYDNVRNVYICPANQLIPYSFESHDHDKVNHAYLRVLTCKPCPLKSQCTTSVARRIKRWEHEDRLEQTEALLAAWPESMNLRKSTAEHPFGTLKSWMGATHFLTRRLPNVNTEMSLHVLAYNLKRMINIMGVRPLMAAMQG